MTVCMVLLGGSISEGGLTKTCGLDPSPMQALVTDLSFSFGDFPDKNPTLDPKTLSPAPRNSRRL